MGALGVGIIGSGVHGSRYAAHIRADLPGLRLVAVSRRSAAGARQAREWECAYHADWAELVADARVEAVIAAATPDLNPAIARACAAAGKALLVEKPLAITVADGEAMVAVMDSAGLPFTVAQTLRYNTVIRALRAELGRAGPLHAFSADQRLERSRHAWLEEPAVAGGGVILHTAVHLFDALRFVTGREVVAVRAQTRQRYNPRLEDQLLATLTLAGDLIGAVCVSKVGPGRTGRYEFVGDAGVLTGDQIHGELALVKGARREPLPLTPPGPTLVPLLSDWAAHLRGEAVNPIPAAEGLAALRVCAACARSARAGGEVEL